MGLAPPQMGVLRRPFHQQTVNTPSIAASSYVTYLQTLPVNAIGDGFTLDSWCLTFQLPVNFTVLGLHIYMNWFADAAGTNSPGYVELPVVGPVLPFTNPAASSQPINIGFANAFTNYYFGPDVQTQGGFSRYWQVEYAVVVQNVAASASVPTIQFMIVWR